jgi:hypothetical protein
MVKKQPECWIVQRESDGAFLCIDGLWRRHLAGIEDFRTFRRDVNAIKYGLKFQDGTAFALYPEDSIDVCGVITRRADHFANVSSLKIKGRKNHDSK